MTHIGNVASGQGGNDLEVLDALFELLLLLLLLHQRPAALLQCRDRRKLVLLRPLELLVLF